MGHFKKHWPMELQDEVIKCIEEVVCETYSNISVTDSLISSRSIT
jgi:hypothetical protein